MVFNIEKALNTKIKLRQKLVRIEHHLKFLIKCKEEEKTPKGLKIQKEIRIIDSPDSHQAKATIEEIFIKAEHEVVGVLIDHYGRVKRDTMEELKSIEMSIENNMDSIRKDEMTPVVRKFQEIMERGECTLASSLEEKRNKKLLQLTSCSLITTPPPSSLLTSSLLTSHAPAHSSPLTGTRRFPRDLRIMKSSARKTTPYKKPKNRPKVNASAGTGWSSPRRVLNKPPAGELGSELKEIKDTLRSLVSRVYNFVESGVCGENASLLVNHGHSVVSGGVLDGLLIGDEMGGGGDQGRIITKKAIEEPDSLANLSDVALTHVETSLLKKGLSFIPTPHKIHSNFVLGESIDLLRDKHKSRFMLPKRSLRLLDCCFEGIKFDISHSTVLNPIPNLTSHEKRAIRGLKNKDICITKADKGDCLMKIINSKLFPNYS